MRWRLVLALVAAGVFGVLTTGASSCGTSTTNKPDTTGGTGKTGGSGKRGAPKKIVAHVGSSITLSGQDDGERLKVTVLNVIDPAVGGEFDQVTAGKRRVGVMVALRNVGTAAFHDSPQNGAKIVTTADEQGDSTLVGGGICGGNFASDVTLSPGSREKGCLAFEVPKAAKLKLFQYALDSGFGPQTGEWSLLGAG